MMKSFKHTEMYETNKRIHCAYIPALASSFHLTTKQFSFSIVFICSFCLVFFSACLAKGFFIFCFLISLLFFFLLVLYFLFY